jgi:3-mercaptopyruvate sulfurtransferase SseA
MQSFEKITTNDLFAIIDEPNLHIIDTRPVHAYNGWKLEKQKRSGHIKGARCLPHKWSKYMDWIEIVHSKGISTEDKIVLYGSDKKQTVSVADTFYRNGFKNIYLYEKFIEEWTADESYPMEYLKNYRMLVYPDWLKTLIDGGNPPEYENDKYVICHTHYRNHEDYLKGHIQGAVALDTLELESPETWNRRSPEELKQALEAKGITHDTTVILYGRFGFPKNEDPFPGSSAGQIAAMRCAFIMLYAGVKDVRILNGAVQGWLDAGYDLTSEITEPAPVTDFGAEIPQRPELAVDVPEAKEMLASDEAELVSVRSWPEFIGKVSGYNYIEKTGRIPGAIFGNCGTDAYHMENYRNLDFTTREFQEVVKNWEEADITPDKHIAFYCGTGWRGSEAFMNAYLLGWQKISVFDGGWFEWSSDPNNPFETGEPL